MHTPRIAAVGTAVPARRFTQGELAKLFGSEAAPKFVNGVLATAVGGRKDAST